MSDENKMRDVSWHQYSEMCKIAEQAEQSETKMRLAKLEEDMSDIKSLLT